MFSSRTIAAKVADVAYVSMSQNTRSRSAAFSLGSTAYADRASSTMPKSVTFASRVLTLLTKTCNFPVSSSNSPSNCDQYL